MVLALKHGLDLFVEGLHPCVLFLIELLSAMEIFFHLRVLSQTSTVVLFIMMKVFFMGLLDLLIHLHSILLNSLFLFIGQSLKQLLRLSLLPFLLLSCCPHSLLLILPQFYISCSCFLHLFLFPLFNFLLSLSHVSQVLLPFLVHVPLQRV